jgi:hypothetical protein
MHIQFIRHCFYIVFILQNNHIYPWRWYFELINQTYSLIATFDIFCQQEVYSTMVHRNIHVRTYIDNKPYSTMVHRHIHVRTYKPTIVLYGLLSIYIRTCMFLWTIVLYGLLSIYVRIYMCLLTIVLYGLLSIYVRTCMSGNHCILQKHTCTYIYRQ